MCLIEIEEFMGCTHRHVTIIPCVIAQDALSKDLGPTSEAAAHEAELSDHDRHIDERVEIQVMSACNVCILSKMAALNQNLGLGSREPCRRSRRKRRPRPATINHGLVAA